jgi:hypothetical protein
MALVHYDVLHLGKLIGIFFSFCVLVFALQLKLKKGNIQNKFLHFEGTVLPAKCHGCKRPNLKELATAQMSIFILM